MNGKKTEKRADPLLACVLIGGKSSRMGRPKHLLTQDGRFWLEHTVAVAAAQVDAVLLAGSGRIPPSLTHLTRLHDAAGAHGPMAGIMAALRHHPGASWLVLACDLPALHAEALAWLLAEMRPQDLALFPYLEEREQVEPLFACYHGTCLPHLERLAASGTWGLSQLRHVPGVRTVRIPPTLRPAWRNINTPQQLQHYLSDNSPPPAPSPGKPPHHALRR